METENNSDKKSGEEILKDLNKSIKKINRISNFMIFTLNFLKYAVLWAGISFFIYMTILPILFFWTEDYLYLKIFGTTIFGTIALSLLGWGLLQTHKYTKLKK